MGGGSEFGVVIELVVNAHVMKHDVIHVLCHFCDIIEGFTNYLGSTECHHVSFCFTQFVIMYEILIQHIRQVIAYLSCYAFFLI